MKGLSLRKKIIFIALTVFIAMTCLYSSPQNMNTAKAVTTSSGLVFENGIIKGYEGSATTVVIPATINGQTVKSISGAFKYNDVVKEIVISEGVTALTDGAFFYCPNLEKITIPSTINNISEGSLAAGEKLSQIVISEDNTYFTLLDDILYTADMTEIVQAVCANIPSTFAPAPEVTTIRSLSMAFCPNLASVTLPNTIYTIGFGPFAFCSNLDSITVDDLSVYYQSIDGVLFTENGQDLIQYPGNKSGTFYTIPEDVRILGAYSFSGTENLLSLTITDSVGTFYSAFEGCYSVVDVNVTTGNSVYSSTLGVVFSKDKSIFYFYPYGRTDASYTVPASITTIAPGAFMSHPHLQTLTLNEGVTDIHYFGIAGCPKLTKLVIPRSVTNFEFFSVTGIDDLAIWGYAGSEAETYADTYNITFVAIGDSTEWDYSDNGDGTCQITKYKGEDTHVYVPSVLDGFKVQSLAHTTFDGCELIEYITFFESISLIEASNTEGSAYIFEDCKSLREIYLPASLQSITTYTAPYKPFKGATSLVNVFVDSGNAAFYDKEGVLFSQAKSLLYYPSGKSATSYTIPNGTTSISYTAFDNNALKTVKIPGTVASLSAGDEATFKNNIETVRIESGVKTVADVFSRTQPMKIYFPESVTSISGFLYPDVPHTFYVYENSAAHIYADENNIPYILLCLVSYETNGGTKIDSHIVLQNNKIAEPDDPVRDGFVLKRWCTDEELTNEWSFANAVTGNLTLYADWIEGYPIIYHMNGGTNDKDNPDYYVAGKVLILDDPTKKGYTFDGWYTHESCKLDYKFEAIEKDTTGPVELWADWWVITAPPSDDTDDHGTSSGNSSPVVNESALSDERTPELSQSDFPDQISYMAEGQTITVKGKIYIKYAEVDSISVMYSGHTDKLYKYEDGGKRLSSYNYSHTFDVSEIIYSTKDKYIITVRLSTAEYYQHIIPIYKYRVVTEVLNAPRNDIYMNSEKIYELRTMAIASNSFDLINAAYEVLTPETCRVKNGIIEPLAAGEAQIKTKVTLEDGSEYEFVSSFNIIDRMTEEPSELEKELMCPCYGDHCSGFPEEGIDPALIELIEKIRAESGVNVYILSGYRCPEHNKRVGGEEDSEHVHGRAADLWSDEISLDELYAICDKLNDNGGVGIYEDHIHVDTRGVHIRWEDE